MGRPDERPRLTPQETGLLLATGQQPLQSPRGAQSGPGGQAVTLSLAKTGQGLTGGHRGHPSAVLPERVDTGWGGWGCVLCTGGTGWGLGALQGEGLGVVPAPPPTWPPASTGLLGTAVLAQTGLVQHTFDERPPCTWAAGAAPVLGGDGRTPPHTEAPGPPGPERLSHEMLGDRPLPAWGPGRPTGSCSGRPDTGRQVRASHGVSVCGRRHPARSETTGGGLRACFSKQTPDEIRGWQPLCGNPAFLEFLLEQETLPAGAPRSRDRRGGPGTVRGPQGSRRGVPAGSGPCTQPRGLCEEIRGDPTPPHLG